MRLRNAGKGEALPSLFPRFAPNTHIYPAMTEMHLILNIIITKNTVYFF
jgi:hypothetical protein